MDRSKYEKIFYRESRRYLAELDELLLTVEEIPENRMQWNEIHGKLHSIKGMARSLEFDRIMQLSHRMEDWCKAFQQGEVQCTLPMVELLTDGVRLLRRILDAGRPENETENDRVAFDHLMETFSRSPQSAVSIFDTGVKAENSLAVPAIDEVRVPYATLEHILGMAREVLLFSRNPPLAGEDAFGQDLRIWVDQNTSRIKELHLGLEQLRLVRLGDFVSLYERPVRDIARELGKQAKIVVIGGDIEADITLLERLREAFLHLFRNCVAHGIETSDVRKKKGKPPAGVIRVVVSREKNRLKLLVADDGQGIDKKAIQRFLSVRKKMSEETIQSMTDDALLHCIFDPSFSSAETTDSLAGRGIGMHVVWETVKQLEGSIHVRSTPETGTVFSLSFPVFLSVLYAVVFHIGDFLLAIPTQNVLSIRESESDSGADREDLESMYRLLEQEPDPEEPSYVVSVKDASGTRIRFSFLSGRIEGNRPVMMMPSPLLLSRQKLYAGVGVLETGELAVVLDVEVLSLRLTEKSPKPSERDRHRKICW